MGWSGLCSRAHGLISPHGLTFRTGDESVVGHPAECLPGCVSLKKHVKRLWRSTWLCLNMCVKPQSRMVDRKGVTVVTGTGRGQVYV